MACWGGSSAPTDDDFQTIDVVDSVARHHCGVRERGEVDCWSYSDDVFDVESFGAPVDLPANLVQPLELSIGEEHGCVLDASGEIARFGNIEQPTGCETNSDGELVCWGQPQDSDRFTDLACGGRHCCALESDGTAYCWGGGPVLAHPKSRSSKSPLDAALPVVPDPTTACAAGATWSPICGNPPSRLVPRPCRL